MLPSLNNSSESNVEGEIGVVFEGNIPKMRWSLLYKWLLTAKQDYLDGYLIIRWDDGFKTFMPEFCKNDRNLQECMKELEASKAEWVLATIKIHKEENLINEQIKNLDFITVG